MMTNSRASWEGAHRKGRSDAPVKNYTIKHQYVDCEQKTNNKICIIAMLYTVCSTLITVVYVKVVILRNIFARRYRNMRGAHTRGNTEST